MDSHIYQPRQQSIGVVPPPLGITPNFVDPPSNKNSFLIPTVIVSAISTCFVCLRLYTAHFILHKFGIDDYMVIVSEIFGLASSVCGCILLRYGLGLHLWDIAFSTLNIHFWKFIGIIGAMYAISILFTKLSILVFYMKLSGPSGKIRKAIWVTIIIVTAYSLIGAFEWAYACRPIEKYWDLTITYGHCIDQPKIYVFIGVMNTLTDATILFLPIFMMWNLRLRLRQKIAVVLIMMTGGFVLIVSIIRVSMTAKLSYRLDKTWFFAPLVAWIMVEAHIAIVCACLPAGKPFLRRHFPKVIGSSAHRSLPIEQTLRSKKATQSPAGELDEIPLNVQHKAGQDGDSQTNGSTCTVERVDLRDIERV